MESLPQASKQAAQYEAVRFLSTTNIPSTAIICFSKPIQKAKVGFPIGYRHQLGERPTKVQEGTGGKDDELSGVESKRQVLTRSQFGEKLVDVQEGSEHYEQIREERVAPDNREKKLVPLLTSRELAAGRIGHNTGPAKLLISHEILNGINDWQNLTRSELLEKIQKESQPTSQGFNSGLSWNGITRTASEERLMDDQTGEWRKGKSTEFGTERQKIKGSQPGEELMGGRKHDGHVPSDSYEEFSVTVSASVEEEKECVTFTQSDSGDKRQTKGSLRELLNGGCICSQSSQEIHSRQLKPSDWSRMYNQNQDASKSGSESENLIESGLIRSFLGSDTTNSSQTTFKDWLVEEFRQVGRRGVHLELSESSEGLDIADVSARDAASESTNLMCAKSFGSGRALGAKYIQIHPQGYIPNKDSDDKRIMQVESNVVEYFGPVDRFQVSFRLPYFTPTRIPHPITGSLPGHCGSDVVVGPVVGLVTSTSARILLEVNKDWPTAVVALQAIGEQIQAVTEPVTKALRRGQPSIFVFENLFPGTYYRVHCNLYVPHIANSGFRTQQPDMRLRETHARIAVVSGTSRSVAFKDQTTTKPNSSEETEKSWKTLYELANRGEINMIVHVNGALNLNGYTNSESESPIFRALEVARNDNASGQTICEIFRNVFRRQWAEPFIRHTLANCPNIFGMSGLSLGIYSQRNEIDLTSHEGKQILFCAFLVSLEYEQQLSIDISTDFINLLKRIIEEKDYLDRIQLPAFLHDVKSFDQIQRLLVESHSNEKLLPPISDVYNTSSVTSDFNEWIGSNKGAFPASLHSPYVFGDVALIILDDLMSFLFENEFTGYLLGQIYTIKKAFTQNGVLHGCRFVLIVLPQTLFEDNAIKASQRQAVTAIREYLCNMLMEAALRWQKRGMTGRRKFCFVTRDPTAASLQTIKFEDLECFHQIVVPPMQKALQTRLLKKSLKLMVGFQQQISFQNNSIQIKDCKRRKSCGFFVLSAYGHYEDTLPNLAWAMGKPMETRYAIAFVDASSQVELMT